MSLEAVIGLEVHAELSCKTKLYCGCENAFGGAPNTRCCPICTGQPGTLPVTNRRALSYAVRVGADFGCTVNSMTRQYRKQYFYPDLPKGYQISQYYMPLCEHGLFSFEFDGGRRDVRIRQLHLEEDAGKLVHGEDGCTSVDYNRCGVPLIEIVTEPDIRSPEELHAFLEAVRIRLMYLGVSDCKMEQGSMRCDVNVSVRHKGAKTLGERVEMKNINTFSGAERAARYELERQMALLENGGEIRAETRRWDDTARKSVLMRTKESSADYRYFPEPDIPAYRISEAFIRESCKNTPERELSRIARYLSLGTSKSEAEILTSSPTLAAFFDECASFTRFSDECAKLLVGYIASLSARTGCGVENSKLVPRELAAAAELMALSKISRESAQQIIEALFFNGGTASELAKRHMKIDDLKVIERIVLEVLSENRKAADDYANGNSAAMTFLMGACMKKLHGRADAASVRTKLSEKLK